MIRVVIESPFAGDRERNHRYLRAALRDSLGRGEACFASHAIYPLVLSDDVLEDRELGIRAGFEWQCAADRVAAYVDLGVSPGMERGIAHARRRGIQVEERRLGGEWAA